LSLVKLPSVNDLGLRLWNFDCKIVCLCARSNYFCDSCRLCDLCLFILLGKNRITLCRFRDFNLRLRFFVTLNALCVCACVRARACVHKCNYKLIFEAVVLFI
jgi:hypothetical protein